MNFIPIFEHGLILKKHMLDSMRDYPIEFVQTFYSEMGEGIITGLDIVLTDTGFYVGEGIIKLKGVIYLIEKTEEILFREKNNYVYLILEQKKEVDGMRYVQRVIQSETKIDKEFELFRYVKNAEMKEYNDLYELFRNDTNRIDQRNTLFSLHGGSSIPNTYYKLFAKKILKSANANIKDIAFAYHCLNGIYSVEIIKEYFDMDISDNQSVITAMKAVRERLDNGVEVVKSPEKPQKQREMQIQVY